MAELSFTQREILRALVELYSKNQKLIKSTEIAEALGKDDGTIRNIILNLKSLGLVESKTGPSGGYKPTSKAYSYLRALSDIISTYAKIRKNGEEVNVYVLNVELMDLTNPYSSKAVLKVAGDIDLLKPGDRIKVGPLPTYRLVLSGIILLVDAFRSEIVIEVEGLVSIPKVSAKSIVNGRKLLIASKEHPINEVAKILITENIRGLPVIDNNGELIGMITSADILKAFINNDSNASISNYLRTNIVTVLSDEELVDIINKMIKHNTGRVIVLNDGKPIGIITRTDILQKIAALD
ncbi:MAG: CBS domain-containing protein [Sulfolobales archaeon]|nr:CBS domain-containing protein [Sulfolobales archaeon]MDW7969911.1 CBS domain-containing protein [Sulfolobales archaeon]